MEQRKSTGRRTIGARLTRVRLVQRKSVGMMAVYEQDGSDAANESTTRTLVFEWGDMRTRTTDYPAQWQLLSDDELTAMRKRTLE
ncbi:MAG TPA: hypothetical protein VJ867_09115 [Gemmatimonadaceae bacterium]|nr:hypothetical protein [Gemmatimonadaceae bacterium]